MKINSNHAPAPIGPYSQGVLKNNTLYLSGQIPVNPDTNEMIKGSIKLQTKQIMENIKHILQEAGMDFDNIVKSTIFLKDMKQFPEVNETYGSFFKNEYPARETVQVSALPKDADIEISVIAVK